MPRNGSGVYTLPSGNPVVTGTTISSTWANNTLSDMAVGLTNSIAKDGQTVPTNNLPMGGYKLVGLGPGSAAADSVNLAQVQSGAYCWLTSVSGTDTITASATPGLPAYAAGQQFVFAAAGANTGAVTLNIDSLGAVAVTKLDNAPLVSGDIPANSVVIVTYTGTNFRLTNLAASFATTATTATTATNLAGGSAGQMPYQTADGSTSMRTAADTFTAIKQAATTSATGVVELATNAEVAAGTDTTRAVTPAGLASAYTSWPGVYTGTSATNTNFPVGSYVLGGSAATRNSTVDIGYVSDNNISYGFNETDLSGTWRARGYTSSVLLSQRTS